MHGNFCSPSPVLVKHSARVSLFPKEAIGTNAKRDDLLNLEDRLINNKSINLTFYIVHSGPLLWAEFGQASFTLNTCKRL